MIIAIDLKPLKATMPTTPRRLDQISAEKTKVGERLARLDADRATVIAQLTDLETAERVLMRVSKTPPAHSGEGDLTAGFHNQSSPHRRAQHSRRQFAETYNGKILNPSRKKPHGNSPRCGSGRNTASENS